ncbi:hypothetical protein RYH80_15690 [Halobaculum sp. MBLA0147]|uniref:hypothetical protein n=1 Tax=Halobaculum sp. MBLA0147 TaxID=3079934 RepID=UPI003524389B
MRSTDDPTESTTDSTAQNSTGSTIENGTDADPIWTTTRVPPTDEETADTAAEPGRTTRRLY